MLQQNPSRSQHPLDRPLTKGTAVVSLSAFSFLFSELVQYHQSRVESISDLERRLEESGYGVGIRLLELYTIRESAKNSKREVRIIGILQFIAQIIWKGLFNKTADSLEKSMEGDDTYMLYEANPVTNTFVSVPTSLGQLNVASYISGIIAGILNASQFGCRVTAHFAPSEISGNPDRTVFLVKFDKDVMEREAALDAR
jgi:hypothetical protein